MGFVSARRPGWLLEAARERRPRGMVAYPPQGGGQNPAYRPSDIMPPLRRAAQGLCGPDGAQHISFERLGVSALARLWLGPRDDDGAHLRPPRLRRAGQLPRAEVAQQPGSLVFLRDARGRIQSRLELFRGAFGGRGGASRGVGNQRRIGLCQCQPLCLGRFGRRQSLARRDACARGAGPRHRRGLRCGEDGVAQARQGKPSGHPPRRQQCRGPLSGGAGRL